MTTPGVDYAWSHPGGAALKAAGKKFACRYLSGDSSKNLTKTEANDLAAHGISSVVVWETTANRALGGKAAGAADAKTAAAQAAAVGMPAGRPIYFAVDFDATAAQQAAINAYLDGAASVIGRARVGIYGGYYPVKRALDAGKAVWAWQTIAWSGGLWDARAHMRQGAQKTIAGVGCDLNTAMVADYGQWMPGIAPKPPTPDVKDDDMPDNWDRKDVTHRALPVGKWTTLNVGGTSLATGITRYTATMSLTLVAPAGGTVQARWFHLRKDKSRWTSPIVERETTDGSSFPDFTHGGSIDAAETACVELIYYPANETDKAPATITAAHLRGLTWK